MYRVHKLNSSRLAGQTTYRGDKYKCGVLQLNLNAFKLTFADPTGQ